MASPTPNKAYTYPAHGGAVGAWDTPLNTNFDWIDLSFGGAYPITVTSTATTVTYNSSGAIVSSTAASVTIPTSLAQNIFYNVTGTLTQNLTVNMSSAGAFYVFGNNTSGAFTTTVQPNGGSGLSIQQSAQTAVICTSTGANAANNQGNLAAITTTSITAQSVTASSAVTAQSVAASSAVSGQSVTASSGLSGAIISGNVVATQADQEAGTATNLVVSPGRQQYHVSAAKAHGRMIGGTTGGIDYAYNIASNTRLSVGDFRVVFTAIFSGTFYTAVVTPIDSATRITSITAMTSNSFSIKFSDNAGTDVDPQAFCVACFGDQ